MIVDIISCKEELVLKLQDFLIDLGYNYDDGIKREFLDVGISKYVSFVIYDNKYLKYCLFEFPDLNFIFKFNKNLRTINFHRELEFMRRIKLKKLL